MPENTIYDLAGTDQLTIADYIDGHLKEYGTRPQSGIDQGGAHHATHETLVTLNDIGEVEKIEVGNIVGDINIANQVVISISNAILRALKNGENNTFARVNIVYKNKIQSILDELITNGENEEAA